MYILFLILHILKLELNVLVHIYVYILSQHLSVFIYNNDFLLLLFVSGKCIGPIVSGFQYDTHKGLKAIPIKFHANGGQHKEFCFRSYVNGGGFFQPYDSFRNFAHVQNVQVLASYINFPNMPAAIVKCAVGVDGGMAILTGTHPEFCVFEMDCSDPDLQKHQKDLEADDEVREKCFRHLLQAANLEVNKKYSDRTVTSKI